MIAATIAATLDLAKLPNTSYIRPEIFTAASSLESSETHSPLVPSFDHSRRPVANPSQSATLLMQRECNSSFPSEAYGFSASYCLRKRRRFPKPRTYLLEWPLSARRRRYRIGCKRSRGGPLTQTQSQTESYKPQPTSKTCPSPAILYSFVTTLYFSYPTQLFRSEFAQ